MREAFREAANAVVRIVPSDFFDKLTIDKGECAFALHRTK